MTTAICGRVITLGDEINTDVIAPGRWKQESLEVLKLHTMEGIVPQFFQQVQSGDILVAGRNFGCGSHREQAVQVMQALGIQAIVAESVARLYLRSGIALGLPVFEVPGISALVAAGEMLKISFRQDAICFANCRTQEEILRPALPPMMREVLLSGGIYQLLRTRIYESDSAGQS